VRDVRISLKGKVVAESLADGFFSVTVRRSEPRIALTFAAEGHVANTRVYNAKTRDGNTVVIWPVAYRIRFDASRPLDVQLGSSRIVVPARALKSRAGKTVSVSAQLEFTLLDVTNPLQQAAASGDFTGRLPDGKLRRLNSWGIFDFDIHDAKGTSFTLRDGAEIELSIAIPFRLVKRAPARVGYYDFDPASGIWMHAGTFGWVPSTLAYNGTVKRFGGAHNLDDPQDTTCVTVQVINLYNGSGLPNMSVTAHGLQYASYGTTNANGFVCLVVDRNANFTVTAQGSVGGTFWGTPQPVVLMSPNIASTASDCGNPTLCPFVGTVPADFVVGIAPGIPSAL
jgi:hypothetical protein